MQPFKNAIYTSSPFLNVYTIIFNVLRVIERERDISKKYSDPFYKVREAENSSCIDGQNIKGRGVKDRAISGGTFLRLL